MATIIGYILLVKTVLMKDKPQIEFLMYVAPRAKIIKSVGGSGGGGPGGHRTALFTEGPATYHSDCFPIHQDLLINPATTITISYNNYKI